MRCNPAITLWLQSWRLVGRVAELVSTLKTTCALNPIYTRNDDA